MQRASNLGCQPPRLAFDRIFVGILLVVQGSPPLLMLAARARSLRSPCLVSASLAIVYHSWASSTERCCLPVIYGRYLSSGGVEIFWQTEVTLFHPCTAVTALDRSFLEYFLLLAANSLLCCRCRHCRDHFLEMYDNCDNGRCVIPKASNMRGQHTSTAEPALALWVWRMHNAVNTANAIRSDKEPHT